MQQAASVVWRWACWPLVQTRPKPSAFSGEKILSTPSCRGEGKPSVPCRKFTACKRTQKWGWRRHFRQNSRQFLARSSTFRCWGSLASFRTWGTPGGGSWNVLITGPPSWGFDVPLATALCKTFLLRILNDSWAGHNPQGLQCRWRRRRIYEYSLFTQWVEDLARWGTKENCNTSPYNFAQSPIRNVGTRKLLTANPPTRPPHTEIGILKEQTRNTIKLKFVITEITGHAMWKEPNVILR